jgi:hypothetical protein
MWLAGFLAAAGFGFVVGHSHVLGFVWESLAQLPALAHHKVENSSLQTVSRLCILRLCTQDSARLGLGMALLLGVYVVGIWLPLMHLTERVQVAFPQGLPRTCIYYSPNTNSTKPRYFFLFDTALLLTKRTGKKRYWLKVYVHLRHGVTLVDNGPADTQFRCDVHP